ncbi:hypothetical protein [Sphingobacterium hotanense]|nr:hypothetical protein [Sphingobacterium hotanense]
MILLDLQDRNTSKVTIDQNALTNHYQQGKLNAEVIAKKTVF